MIKRKTSSPMPMKTYFLRRFRSLIAVFVIFFIISAGTIFFSVYRQNFNHIKQTLILYNEQAANSFDDISSFMLTFTKANDDVTALSLSPNSEEASKHISKVRQTMASGLYSFPSVDGIFLYAGLSDIYINQITASYYRTNNPVTDHKCSQAIEKALRAGEIFPEQKWFVLQAEEDYYFVKLFKDKDTYTGAWVNVDHTASFFRYFSDLNASIFFTDENGTPLNDIGNSLHLQPRSSLTKPEIIRYNDEPHLVISAKLTFSEHYITALVPFYSIHKSILPVYYVLVFAILVSIFLFISAIYFSNRYMDSSVNMLKPVVEEMKKGNFETKIETPSTKFSEIVAITDTYNEMIDEIRELKIDIYEEQLKKQELELQYLKNQLAPHFLINCLNTIFMLTYDNGNTNLIQKIIKTLSDHLRYSLSKQTRVSMKEEIYYTKNYLTLTQLRFPESLDYTIECDEDLEDATVFPLMILLLAENTIKVNLVLGEHLEFNVKIHKYSSENEERVKITCTDTGRGFDKTELMLYNNIEENLDIIRNGNHIGLQNIFTRLKIIFGESAKLIISNSPDGGAKIDMDLPYVPFSQDL